MSSEVDGLRVFTLWFGVSGLGIHIVRGSNAGTTRFDTPVATRLMVYREVLVSSAASMKETEVLKKLWVLLSVHWIEKY